MSDRADELELPKPAAHMYPSDLERFAASETFAHAYSVAVGNPEERSVPLFTLSQLVAYAQWSRAAPTVATREPLTDEQIDEATAPSSLSSLHLRGVTTATVRLIARAIERAHGIAARGTSTASTDGEAT